MEALSPHPFTTREFPPFYFSNAIKYNTGICTLRRGKGILRKEELGRVKSWRGPHPRDHMPTRQPCLSQLPRAPQTLHDSIDLSHFPQAGPLSKPHHQALSWRRCSAVHMGLEHVVWRVSCPSARAIHTGAQISHGGGRRPQSKPQLPWLTPG